MSDRPRDVRGHASPASKDRPQARPGSAPTASSKDSRDDLPQVIVGMAVTRDGIPVRVWSWPGNTADTDLIRQVKTDLRQWALSKVIWVADRGFYLRGEPPLPHAGRRRVHHRGEAPLRLPRGEGRAVPAGTLQGRPGQPAGQGSPPRRRRRPVHHLLTTRTRPNATPRSATSSSRSCEETIAGTDTLTTAERARLEGVISTKPGLKRFLRVTPAGLLRVDKTKIKTEENLDGKYLLRCCDPHLSRGVGKNAVTRGHLGSRPRPSRLRISGCAGVGRAGW